MKIVTLIRDRAFKWVEEGQEGKQETVPTPQSLALFDRRGDHEDGSPHTNGVLAWSVCYLHSRSGIRYIHHGTYKMGSSQ
jgi:hypothetical protein